MAIVKMNSEEFADIESNIKKAYESLEAADNCWGTNFDNLYNNIADLYATHACTCLNLPIDEISKI